MKRFSIFLFSIFVLFTLTIKAQNSIQLVIIGDISSIDIGSIIIANDLEGKPRLFQLIMNTQPPARKVFLTGKISWKENLTSSFKELYYFKTNTFNARNIFSDELGNSDIKIEENDGNKDLYKELIGYNKAKGVFGILISMFSENGEFLDDDYQELTFLNPTQTFSITQPQNNDEVDIGNVICSWSSVLGAINYEVKACVLENETQNPEDALSSSNPIINNYNAGTETSINLSSISKNREWFSGQKIVVEVKAIINDSGTLKELKSEPVIFTLRSLTATPSISLIRFSNIFNSIIPYEVLNKINDGSLQLENITFKDENGNIISNDEFNKILNMLEANPSLIINSVFNRK